MSTPDGEPMFPADYGTPEMTRDMALGWDVPRIAGDRELVKAVLREYTLLLMFENPGELVGPTVGALVGEALVEAIKEYHSSRIIKEAR